MNKHFSLIQNSRYVKKKLMGDDVWHPFRLKSVRLGYESLLKIKGEIYINRIEREVVEYRYRSIGEVIAEFCSDPEPPYMVETDRHEMCIYLGKKDMGVCYKKGQDADAMDEDGNWWSAKILDHRHDGKYLVHFHGWDSKWDRWNDPLEISPFRSVVKDWSVGIKPGEHVELRMKDMKWYMGFVREKTLTGDAILVEDFKTTRQEWIKTSDERVMPINTHIRGIGRIYPFPRWSDPGGEDVWWIHTGFRVALSRQVAV
jgi:hypothetical protein